MEGILEKPSLIPGKKTKVWSILDESTLSFFRENKRSSCIGSIDLSDIQFVRIASNCQFEIKTENNSQVYTAESNKKCDEWVQKLTEYSKCTTTSGEPIKSTPRKNSIFNNKEAPGEHTVEVRAAKNIFEKKMNVPQNKRAVSSSVLSKPSHEPLKPSRKSDPTKLYPWSTITEAKTHLNHVSIERDNEKETESLSKTEATLKNSVDIITKITTDSKPNESVQNNSGHSLKATEFGSLEPEANVTHSPNSLKDSVDDQITTNITDVNYENIEEKGKNEDSKTTVSTIPEIASASNNPGVLKTENSEHKRDSGYSTTVGEGDRNSHENKVDESVSSEFKQETEQTKNSNSSVTEETNNNQNDANTSEQTIDHQDVDEEPVQTRVVMRKSRSVVSVSHDDTISFIDIDDQEYRSTDMKRTGKTTQEQNPSENKDMKYEPSIDTVENSETNTLPNLRKKKEVREINNTGGDAVDGGAIGEQVEPVPLRHEIVENYIDIDKIICPGNFPNVPVLPNNAPNRHDLVSVQELKDLLESYDESSDEHSDIDSIISAEDPIQRLLRMVEV